MIADSIRMVGERARRRGLRVVADGVDNCIVVADERAIKQITLNLLSNAVKFSKERDEIQVGAWFENDGSFVLEVEDHGIGMTEEGIARALQPFGQINTPATRSQSGTGLGLPITKGLVEAHGGQLFLESSPGVGTTVRVILPPPARIPGAVLARPAAVSVRAERAVA
jgi:signal transduction histidine kinase